MLNLRERYSARYIFKRIVGALSVYFVALIIIFIIPHLMPGNIAYQYVGRIISANPTLSYQAALNIIEKEYGLNLPIASQFILYLKNVVLHFPPNFGKSFEFYPHSASSLVLRALPFTLLLVFISQGIAWGVSIFLGIFLATRNNKRSDKVSVPALYLINSLPMFWVGMMMILVFSIYLHVFPAIVPVSYGSPIGIVLSAMELPVIIVVVSTLPNHTLIIRSSTIDFIKSDFVMALKAEGLKNSTLMVKLIRNSILPSITNFFLQLGYLIGGIYVIESLFSLPGMGTVIITAALNYDYPLLEAGLYITTLAIILSNLIADLLYPVLDPRVKYT